MGHGEGFCRQRREAHVVAPVGEQFPLCAIDAPGVVGEDGLQGVGHALVGGAQGRQSRGRAGRICGSLVVVVMEDLRQVDFVLISASKSCAIT